MFNIRDRLKIWLSFQRPSQTIKFDTPHDQFALSLSLEATLEARGWLMSTGGWVMSTNSLGISKKLNH
jgi:hypothetical protein